MDGEKNRFEYPRIQLPCAPKVARWSKTGIYGVKFLYFSKKVSFFRRAKTAPRGCLTGNFAVQRQPCQICSDQRFIHSFHEIHTAQSGIVSAQSPPFRARNETEHARNFQ
ncbi:MAG TPA: hypothetical protein PKL15_09460, partial [Saprospiraceae bacterium]|nr:hypothetical protein [Saprospiraceae bacterium]